MKLIKYAKPITALALGLAVLAHPAAVLATEPSAGGRVKVGLATSIGGNFSAGANGSSSSFAGQHVAATAGVAGTASWTPGYRMVDAGVAGSTATDVSGKAYNVSTGSGSGGAQLSGSAFGAATGRAAIEGVNGGASGGASGAGTNLRIVAGTNQGGYANGSTASGFDTRLHYTRNNSPAGLRLAADANGYAKGSNSSGSIDGLNAPGIMAIDASGHFSATTGLAASAAKTAPPRQGALAQGEK